MVQVVLPSRKQGKSGIRPRRSSTLPTCRVGTGEVHTASSFCLTPCASSYQAKILKCPEENQVKRNVTWTIVVSIRFECLQGTQSTVEEGLWVYNPHAVWIRDGLCNVVISTPFANVVLIRGIVATQSCDHICQVYTLYIPDIYMKQVMYMSGIYLKFTGHIHGIRHIHMNADAIDSP